MDSVVKGVLPLQGILLFVVSTPRVVLCGRQKAHKFFQPLLFGEWWISLAEGCTAQGSVVIAWCHHHWARSQSKSCKTWPREGAEFGDLAALNSFFLGTSNNDCLIWFNDVERFLIKPQIFGYGPFSEANISHPTSCVPRMEPTPA